MGNYKFKLSDMIPNAWFYKLKDMNKVQVRRNHELISLSTKEKQSSPVPSKITNYHGMPLSEERKSYHFTRPNDHFHQNYSPIKTTIISSKYLPSAEPPRKSSRRKRRSIKRNRPQAAAVMPPNPLTQDQAISFSSSSDHGSLMLPEYGSDDSSPCKCKLVQNDDKVELLDMVSLPPIITKKHHHPVIRRFSLYSSSSPGVKLRTNTPRIVNRQQRRRRMIEGGRKSLSLSSYAVVKSSNDPRRDFRESMVEMIVENNIRGAKDLEDLLACYLSLNSNHYHHLIIDVFKQLWFDFIHVRRLIN